MNASAIPAYLKPGKRNEIGDYTFSEDEIIRFAKQFDPQYFHIDPEKAKESLFGGLCASGWHTLCVWMKLQRAFAEQEIEKLSASGHPIPEFGPSPGMKNIIWHKPVFADDTVFYSTTVEGIRSSDSRPGWSLMTQLCEGKDQDNEQVFSFNSAVFISL